MDKWNEIVDTAGMALLAIAFAIFAYRLWFLTRAGRAQGEVVDFAQHKSAAGVDGGLPSPEFVQAAIIIFREAGGRRIRFESGIQTTPGRRYVGETVRVAYDPQNPEHAYINEPIELWALPLFLTALGCYALWDHIERAFG